MERTRANAVPAVIQTVLVVDDHEGFRRRVRRLLERKRYRVIEAANGSAAISQVRSARPDIVLLDIHLPDMDGFEVAVELRQAGATGTILLTSTHAAADVEDRVRASAADGFIEKAELTGTAFADAVAKHV